MLDPRPAVPSAAGVPSPAALAWPSTKAVDAACVVLVSTAAVGTVGGKGSRKRKSRPSVAKKSPTHAAQPTAGPASEGELASILGWAPPESDAHVDDNNPDASRTDNTAESVSLTKWTAPGDAAVTSDAEGTTPVDDATSNSSNLPTPFVPPESAAVQDPATQEQSPRRPDVEPRALDPETAEQMAHRAAYDEAARRQAGQKSFSDAAARMNNLAGQDPTIAVELRKMQLTRDITVDAEQRRSFQKLLEPVLAKAQVVSNDPRDVEIIFDLAYDQMLGLGPLGPLWRDDSVTEIMINSYNEIFVSVGGRILDTPFELRSKEALMRMARDLASKVSARTLSAENALVTAELPGARVNFVYGTVTKSGAVITIRKFTKR